MANNVVTMKDMARPKKTPGEQQSAKPRPGYPVFARLDSELGAALDRFFAAQRLKPTLTTVIEAALKEFLQKEGFWPPKKGATQ